MPAIPMPVLGTVPVLSARESLTVVHALRRSGLVRPYRPDQLAAAAKDLATYGMGPGMGPAWPRRLRPDSEAFVHEATRMTFRELDAACNTTAAVLAAVGLVPGSRVGLLARNGPGFYLAMVGASRAGMDVGYLNTGFTAEQVEQVCRAEGIQAVVAEEEFLSRVPHDLRAFVLAVDGPHALPPAQLGSFAPQTGSAGWEPDHRSRHIILTSGTTGRPKGAARTGGGLDSVLAFLTGLQLQAEKRHLIAAPMFHAWGWSNTLFTMLLASTIVTTPRFDAEETLALIERERCEVLVAVPVMLQRIMALPESVRRRYDCSSLERVVVSGSPLPADLALRFMDEFGEVVYNLYGSTEAAFATVAGPVDLRAAPGTAGRPLPGVAVRVVDDEGRDCSRGQIGSIVVGSGTSFRGYTSGDDKARVDGLVAIGDRGWFDDQHRLFIASRDDDMVITGGENVYPITVEQVLHAHPEVADVAVVGRPDPTFGEILVAHVVPVPGSPLDGAELQSWAKGRLAPFQVPRAVVMQERLPRNETGKVLTRKLREQN